MERDIEQSKKFCRDNPGDNQALIQLVYDLRTVGRSDEIPQILQLDPAHIPLKWRLLGLLSPARFAKDGSVRNIQQLARRFARPIQDCLANMDQARLRAELALGILGDQRTFLRLLEVRKTSQARLLRCLRMHRAPVRYMGNYWARKIGHLGQIEFYFRPWKLGLVPSYRPVILVGDVQQVANKPLLDYWKRHFEVIAHPPECERRALEARMLDIDLHVFESTDRGRPFVFYKDACVRAWQQWESEKRGPTFTIDPKHEEMGRATLDALGVPRDAWFATFHVREPGFAGDAGPGPRNASIENYIPAMQDIVARGGYVVRIGNPGLRPLPKLSGVIDLAHNDQRSDQLDLYALAACRLFVGMASGPAQVPHLFGVPTVYTNWIPIPDYPFHGNALLIPKIHRDRLTRRKLPYRLFVGLHTDYQNKDEGILFEENGAQDIRDVVIEMLDRLDGCAPAASAEDEERQQRFRELAGIAVAAGRPRLGRKFLADNADLLEMG
jgi:putative glycosyltransferase (TIGR04372 family)